MPREREAGLREESHVYGTLWSGVMLQSVHSCEIIFSRELSAAKVWERGEGGGGRKNGMLLIQFKRKGREKGWFFLKVENGLRKVETDSGNFDLKWPLAFGGFIQT